MYSLLAWVTECTIVYNLYYLFALFKSAQTLLRLMSLPYQKKGICLLLERPCITATKNLALLSSKVQNSEVGVGPTARLFDMTVTKISRQFFA